MDPKIWGPPAWKFLDIIILNYPQNPTENDKVIYKSFFESLKNILPCGACKQHYALNLQKYPLTDIRLQSRTNMIYWFLDIHNSVNIMQGKKTISYSDFINKHTIVDNKMNYIIYISCFIIILIMIYIIYTQYDK